MTIKKTIKDCSYCGGTHYGSLACPFLCPQCGKDIRPDAEDKCACDSVQTTQAAKWPRPIAIDLQSSHQEMPDGTHKVTLEVGNLPTLAWAQRVSDWLQVLIRANASRIGQLDRSKQQ